jgi:hypothetical protein
MVFFTKTGGAADYAERFRKKGILINPPDIRGMNMKFRFVTHYWIGDSELETIIAVCREIFTGEQ